MDNIRNLIQQGKIDKAMSEASSIRGEYDALTVLQSELKILKENRRNGTIDFFECEKRRSQLGENLLELLKPIHFETQNTPSLIIGRELEINKIHENIYKNNRKIILVNGVGGIGKTTIAKEYYTKYSQKGYYGYCLWLNFNKTLKNTLINHEGIFKVFNIDKTGDDAIDINKIIKALDSVTNYPNLLVIDNVDSEYTLNEEIEKANHLPSLNNWRVLITSRYQVNTERYHCIRIDTLEEEKAINLFYSITTEVECNDYSKKILSEFLPFIGLHTLTIEILAKIINKKDVTLEESFQEYQEYGIISSELDTDIRTTYNKERRLHDCLIKAFELSRIKENDYIAYILYELSLLPMPITNEYLKKWMGESDKKKFINSINVLHEYGWLEKEKKDNKNQIRVHPLIQEVIRKKIPRQREIVSKTIKLFFNRVVFEAKEVDLEINPYDYIEYIKNILDYVIDVYMSDRNVFDKDGFGFFYSFLIKYENAIKISRSIIKLNLNNFISFFMKNPKSIHDYESEFRVDEYKKDIEKLSFILDESYRYFTINESKEKEIIAGIKLGWCISFFFLGQYDKCKMHLENNIDVYSKYLKESHPINLFSIGILCLIYFKEKNPKLNLRLQTLQIPEELEEFGVFLNYLQIR